MPKGFESKIETLRDKRDGEREFLESLQMLEHAYVKVGVLESAGDAQGHDGQKTGLSVAELATIHEYGSPARNIPQRSFIGSTMNEKFAQFNETTNRLIDQVIERKTSAKKALELLGLMIRTEIKKKIQSNIPPKLKPETIKRKGSDVALIDTAQLIRSIEYSVEDLGRAGSQGKVEETSE